MFVVPYSKIYNDIGASIEFALGFFNITDIIVCGHSQCSACETIFKGVDVKDNRQLEQWLEQNKIIRKRQFFTNNPKEQFEKESLLQQSKNIKTSIIYRYDGNKFVELQA